MSKVLAAGHNMIINNKVGGVSTPFYPITKIGNIYNEKGDALPDVLAGYQKSDPAHMVPDYASEEVSNIRFLRNDNTWATIRSATPEVSGIVKLTDEINVEDSTLAATATAVKKAYDKAAAVETAVNEAGYVVSTQLGTASTDTVTGIATLDESGKVYASQLPSYVDDVLEVGLKATADGQPFTEAVDGSGATVTPESGKIYLNIHKNNIGGTEKDADGLSYRWTSTQFAAIPSALALGETSATAFDGARGKIAYDHSQAAHAMATATEVTSCTDNGYINIKSTADGEVAKTLVYQHPSVEGATETNPHGTTAADVGLGKVENKTVAEIMGDMTADDISAALGYVPQDSTSLASASKDGVMSKAQAAKLDGCLPIYVQKETPTGDGLWFEITDEADPTPSTPVEGDENA